MFDSDAETNHSGAHACIALLLSRHLSMRRGSRMTGQRFGIAQIHEPLDEFQRIIEFLRGLEASLDFAGHQRASFAAKIFLRERIVTALRESCVVDPRHSGMAPQKLSDAPAIL